MEETTALNHQMEEIYPIYQEHPMGTVRQVLLFWTSEMFVAAFSSNLSSILTEFGIIGLFSRLSA